MAKLQIIFAFLVVLFATISFHKSISSFLLQKIDESENPRTLVDAGNNFFPLTKNGQELHYKLKFIADLHTDSLLWTARNLSSSERGFVSMERLRQGNIALQGFYSVSKVPLGHNIYSNSNNSLVDPISVLSLLQHYQSLSLLERNLYHARKLRDLTFTDRNFKIIRTSDEFEEFFIFRQNYFLRNRGGKDTNAPVAGLLGIEGLHCLDNDVSNIGKLFDAGFRLIGISHFFDTTIAGSATGEEKYGLTSFGLEVVKEMEKLRLIADLAHTSPKTIDDFLKHTSLVPLVSHTGVKGTCNNSRNLGDEHAKGIAAKGGVIGIGFWEEAVCGKTPKDVIRAIRYTADLVGVDHVALGSDWDGSIEAIISSEQISQITEGLILEKDENNNRRFSDGDIESIMGLNIKRFLSKHLP